MHILQEINQGILTKMKDTTNYEKCRITNIKRGTGNRSRFIYAHLEDENGVLLICATLDYIVSALADRLPTKTV